MTPKEFLWCGEGDLTPHEIAPASTSTQLSLFRRLSLSYKSMISESSWYHRVS